MSRRRLAWLKANNLQFTGVKVNYNKGYQQRRLNELALMTGTGKKRYAAEKVNIPQWMIKKLQQKMKEKDQKTAALDMVGEQKAVSKRRTVMDSVAVPYADGQLYHQQLCGLERNTGVDELDKRERLSATIKGVHLCFELRNNMMEPMYVNVAVVILKGTDCDPYTIRFFRATGNGRALDFDASVLSANDMHCRPINTDRYGILMHKRFLLNPTREDANTMHGQRSPGTSYMAFDKYIPVNRTFQYDVGATSSDPVNARLMLLWWCNPFMATPTATHTTAAISMSCLAVNYFGDPK